MYKGQNFTTGGSFCEFGFERECCLLAEASGQRNSCAGEDISDNGGVKTAYRAFQNMKGSAKEECIPGLPFSANQLFWVNQSHVSTIHIF